MKRHAVAAPLLLFLLFIASPAFSQSNNNNDEGIQDVMEKLAKDAARAYISPVVSGFGVNLNSGWFHRAPWANMFGFDFEFGVVGMATLFQEENQRFAASGDLKFDYDQANFIAQQAVQQAGNPPIPNLQNDIRNAILSQIFHVDFSGPTVIGKRTDSLKISFPGKQINVNTTAGSAAYNLPGQVFTLPVTGLLEEASAFPLAAPQLTVGTLLGTQFTFRYLPEIKLDEKIGSIKYSGFGIQHNPMVWFGKDAFPIEIGIGYFTQSLTVGSLMEAKATAFGLNGSVRLGWGFLNITPYFGFMLESSSIAFKYDYTIDGVGNVPITQQVTFDAEGENSSRFTIGASVKVLLVNVNADMNFGKYKAVSIGIMIII